MPLRSIGGSGSPSGHNPRYLSPNNSRTVNFLLHPEMQSLVAAILQSLTEFPDARAAVAEELDGHPWAVVRMILRVFSLHPKTVTFSQHRTVDAAAS